MLHLVKIYWSGSIFPPTVFCQYGTKIQSFFKSWKNQIWM